MKINGPNQSNFHPYKQQLQQQAEHKQAKSHEDKLEISSEAKQLQENGEVSAERAAHVQEIKQAVDRGEYKTNHEQTAQKMIDFWRKQ